MTQAKIGRLKLVGDAVFSRFPPSKAVLTEWHQLLIVNNLFLTELMKVVLMSIFQNEVQET